MASNPIPTTHLPGQASKPVPAMRHPTRTPVRP
jgi:hypothetical protein